MWRWILVIIILVLPLSLFGQGAKSDTIPHGAPILKRTGDFIIATNVDTTNTLVINEFLARNSGSVFDNFGDDDDWFEIYNFGDDPILLNNLCFTDDPEVPCKWSIDTSENLYLAHGEHFLIWADSEPEQGFNHASFKLSGDGEYLGISNYDSSLIDQVSYGPQLANISFGRFPDAGLSWHFFDTPTAGEPNLTPGAAEVLPAPHSNHSGGFYSNPVSLILSSTVVDAKIVFTTDCTDPDSTSNLYQEKLEIDSTTIIKARIIKQNAIDGPVLTISIIMDDKLYENPVVSLVADPDEFFGNGGIISDRNHLIEVAANLEYMEHGHAVFNAGTGIQLHSTGSGTPNSLRLYARSRYGNNWFNYSFFKDEGPDQFKRLILRNSGNDNVNLAKTNTHFRDPLVQSIAKSANGQSMVSKSKPVNVFLNGSYYGLFNLRERIDENYIVTHTGVSENFDLLELAFDFPQNQNPISGSFDQWKSLITFADTTGDLSLETDFQYIQEQVDLENFTDYWITEVFTGNYDWLSNNIKFWKPENGKWQWIYWDTDHGLGLVYNNYGKVSWNTLDWSLGFNSRSWQSGYHNILIRNLLKNEGYREYFIKRFTFLLNTSFAYNNTGDLMNSMKMMYQNDMIIHAEKWDNPMADWENACTIVEDYLSQRPGVVFNHIQEYFHLQDPVSIAIKVEPPGAGTVSFSGLYEPAGSIQGKYFPGMTYSFEVQSTPGFVFDRWTPLDDASNPLEFELVDSVELVAHFLPADHSFPIQVTEVYSNNREGYDSGDWIEFYYYGADTLSLGQWQITGRNNQVLYTFDNDSKIGPGEFFIVAENLEQFKKVFPEHIQGFGDLDEGFNDNPGFLLKSDAGLIMKMIDLRSSEEWPERPEEGFSLELKNIIDDTRMGMNWEISENTYGSPGLPNHTAYSFQQPSGKDSTMSNSQNAILTFHTSPDFYSDPDNHDLAGIFVKKIEGPGRFYSNNNLVSSGILYEPSDFIFETGKSHVVSSMLQYSFIDQSGQESSDFSIKFQNITGLNPKINEGFRVYPVPAQLECHFEIPEDHLGPVDFYMFDLKGRLLIQRHTIQADKILTIDLSVLSGGMYIYMLKTHLTVVNGKVEVVR